MRFSWLWVLVFLGACSTPEHEYRSIPMSDTIPSEAIAESMIVPYRDSLELTMNTVLVHNEADLTRGIPESTLGNLVADLLMERVQTEFADPTLLDFCLINIGGLRVDLPKGDITIRKAFELMPFENEITVVKISPEKMQEMLMYLREKGGQPISNMTLAISEDGYTCEIGDEPLDPERSYYIVTSDYLADGGDSMNFFKDPLGRIHTGIKIRDAIIDHFRILGLADKPLKSSLDRRLIIE